MIFVQRWMHPVLGVWVCLYWICWFRAGIKEALLPSTSAYQVYCSAGFGSPLPQAQGGNSGAKILILQYSGSSKKCT